ncbi:teichoic acid biosynthesis protein C [Streptomyces sp. NPDC020965]|uniref:teichoic acid biosynthesis protein C n=1 Tax=Streptomyces sp. NPDC020965 TaxID=3365105 RepID=UPI00379447AA
MNSPQPAPSEALVAPLGVVHPAPGAALLVPSKKIKVNGTTSEAYVREKPAFHKTVMQSLAFDNVNKRIFIAQVIEHDLKLDEHEPAKVPWALRDKNGDLTITMWQWNANLATPAYQFGGRMFLRGYGHGVSIGVEPVGTDSYLWTEVDNIPYLLDAATDRWSGRGKNICRFKFRDTAAPQGNASGHLQKHTPVPGSTHNSVNIDPVYGRLIHRFSLGGAMRYRVHDLDLARMGVWDAYLADVEEPTVSFLPKYGTPAFQGYASVGRYLYLLHGNAYGPAGSTSPPEEGNTHITSVNLTTGDVDYTAHTRAGFTLEHREPEGLAIQVPDITQPEVFRVAMGFAGGPGTGRNVSIYHKPELIAG